MTIEALESRQVMSATVFEYNNVGYFLNSGQSELDRYDLANEQWLSPINLSGLSGPPTVAAADADGIYVAFDRALYRYDLNGGSRTHLINLPDIAFNLHTDGNLLFVIYGTTSCASIDKSTNLVVDTFSGSQYVRNSSISVARNRIIGADPFSPELNYFAYTDSGDIYESFSGHTGYDFPNGGKTWFFPGGGKVADDTGNVFRTDDLTWQGRMPGGFDALDFTANGTPVSLRSNKLVSYSPSTLLPVKSATLASPATEVFVAGNNVFAFAVDASAATGYGVQVVALADFNPIGGGIAVDPVGLAYTPDDVEPLPDGDMLLLEKEHQSIFRWDFETKSYVDSIPLIDTPGPMTYSAAQNAIFVGYQSGLVTRIDLSAVEPREEPFKSFGDAVLGLAATDNFLFVNELSRMGTHATYRYDGSFIDLVRNSHSTDFVWNSVTGKMYYITNSGGTLNAEIVSASGDIAGYGSVTAGGAPLRLSPDGGTVLVSSGNMYNATTLAQSPYSLLNIIKDAAWLNGDVYTMRNISGVVEYQHWSQPTFEQIDSLRTIGSAVALRALPDDTLLGITTNQQGVPVFTILNEDLEVLSPNYAPQLDISGDPALDTVVEGTTDPGGKLISDLIAGKIFDPNPGAQQGIAIFAADAGGTWQFSVSGGAWQNLGSVSATNARLLSAADDTRIRFVPATDFAGQARLQFRAWDLTEGDVLGSLDLTGKLDGYHSVSVAAETLIAPVTNVNDAPVLNTGIAVTVGPVAEDTANPAGTLVSSLVAGITDVDAGALKGIAVSGANNTGGKWQYTLNGTTWLDFGAPTRAAARLLPANASTRVRFLPSANASGTASLWLFAWDQTQGAAGDVVDLSAAGATGGETAFSTAVTQGFVTVTPVNDAPVLNPNVPVVLNPVAEGAANPAGMLVSEFVAGVSDIDASAVKGIAVSGVDNSGGKWQFSSDGTTWFDFFAPTRSNARLLPADATTRIRFVPKGNFDGTSGLYFFAWDRTTGTAGGSVSLYPAGRTGGTTAYSTAVGRATISIIPDQDAPVLNPGVPVALDPVAEDATSNPGTLVSSLLGGVTDPDTGALKGIAISGVTNSGGKWQFTRDAGATWFDFIAPTRSAARLLAADASTRVRFVPNANFNGTSSLYFFAWDQTQGAAGDTVDLSVSGSTGGAAAFSTIAVKATITITPVNDAPLLGGISGSVGYTLGSGAVAVAPAATLNDIDSPDFDTGELVVRITDGTSADNVLELSGFTIDPDNAVFQGATQIGTRTSDGVGTNDLRILLNANATLSVVQQLLRSVTFRATATTGNRTVLFSVSDGDGGLSAELSKTVNVQ